MSALSRFSQLLPRLLGSASLALLPWLIWAPSALASPAWLPASDLSLPGRSATNGVVAMDEPGETIAVWQRENEAGTSHVVQAATRGPGEGFTAPQDLSPAATGPDLAMTASGEGVVVWRHFDVNSGNYEIQATFRSPGGAFSAPADVAVIPNQAAPRDLHVAIDAAGDVAVVWLQLSAEPGPKLTSFVEASVRPAGGSFSAPVIVSPTPLVSGQDAETPRVAIDAGGNVTAVWEYFDGSNEVIQAATRPAGGSFSAPLSLTADGADAFSPSVAVDAAGQALALWTRSDGTSYRVQVAAAPPGGAFSSPTNLSPPGGDALTPEIAMNPAGRAVAVWTRSEGGVYVVQAATAAPGGGFSSAENLSAAGQNAFNPRLALNSDGGAAVVWSRSDGSSEIAEAAIAPASGAFSAAEELSAPGESAVFPMVAIDAAGDATAIWRRSDGSSEIIQAAGYDADAPAFRDLSIPSSGMVGVPVSFSVTTYDVWPIASTDFDFGDGGSASGAAVWHTYAVQGAYRVTVLSSDAAGTTVSATGTITILPSNEFSIERVSLNRKRGTARLFISVPGPGALILAGKGIRRVVDRVQAAGVVQLPVVASGRTKAKLRRGRHVRVVLTIAYTPSGGMSRSEQTKLKLIRR